MRAGRNGNQLGEPSVADVPQLARHEDDRCAKPAALYPCPQPFDGPRNLVAQHQRQPHAPTQHSSHDEDVVMADASRRYSHDRFAVSRLGRWEFKVGDAWDLADRVEYDCSHSPLRMCPLRSIGSVRPFGVL